MCEIAPLCYHKIGASGSPNSISRQKQRLQTRIDETAESELIDQQTPSPAEEAVANEMRGFVAQAISHLSAEHRLAVTMYYIDGLSYREIGEFLEVPQTTIKNRLHRARKQLKKELLNMVENEFESQRLSEEFSEQVLQEMEIADVIRGDESLINPPKPPEPPLLFSFESKEVPIEKVGDAMDVKADFHKLFGENGVTLSKDLSKLSFNKEEDGKWIILDRENKNLYAFQKDEAQADTYNVYDKGATPPEIILLLKPKENSEQRLPIWIGLFEAQAIANGVKGEKSRRPMTHDLCLSLLEAANATVQQVIVSNIQENTYIGKMIIDFNGTVKEIDCHPSDAIGIATRAKVPILVAKKLTDQHGFNAETGEPLSDYSVKTEKLAAEKSEA